MIAGTSINNCRIAANAQIRVVSSEETQNWSKSFNNFFETISKHEKYGVRRSTALKTKQRKPLSCSNIVESM